ncbi:HTTM domain-containing protein [Neolewinella aurantiaca]|uniref:HTTM domain-containing protein n=2 Tax=Neolewinella aurantiaca TaxID=2602767 RepID=A0A5C7FTP1_9BACT|nr:HTTM domain-containing protein [Neolewinella aurantiaca]
MMALSLIRFWWNGWIEKLYLEPDYFFSYRYFEWVKPPGNWTYLLFVIAFVSAIMVMIGWKYRIAIVLFFLSFTYIELMDKTTYLNHYYFITLLSFVLIWLPAANCYSADKGVNKAATVPSWTIDCLKVFVGVVYFYAGLAKLNSDWLIDAQPLSIWLPAKYDIPLLGDLMQQVWVHYAFSWAGAAYDLFIVFFLLWRPTRPLAFVAVIIFHVLTRVLFPIGMFPYIMIVSALIFFPAKVHLRILEWLTAMWPESKAHSKVSEARPLDAKWVDWSKVIVGVVLVLHLLLPWRYLLHPGELFWTEEGYRFSWRVMLMEKAGYLTYKVVDPATGKRKIVNPADYLTTFQNKQLATQPDFILEFAHHLASLHQEKDGPLPAVYAESYVALNGRGSQVYVNPDINLSAITEDTPRTQWLMPFEDTIYGL